MNTIVTSKDAILERSRQLIREQGWTAVNIRTVAAACGVSVGSIYNYFASKSDLISATIESVWRDLFHFPENKTPIDDFPSCVEWIFNRMEKGGEKYPNFFTLHSMNFLGEDKSIGQHLMAQTWEHIQNRLYTVLINDKNVRSGAFDEAFTPKKYVEIIFSLILSAMLQQNYDCSVILELIRRTIYES